MKMYDLKPPRKGMKVSFSPIFQINEKQIPARKQMTYAQAFNNHQLEPFGDADKDKVPNWRDCRPYDAELHGPRWDAFKEAVSSKLGRGKEEVDLAMIDSTEMQGSPIEQQVDTVLADRNVDELLSSQESPEQEETEESKGLVERFGDWREKRRAEKEQERTMQYKFDAMLDQSPEGQKVLEEVHDKERGLTGEDVRGTKGGVKDYAYGPRAYGTQYTHVLVKMKGRQLRDGSTEEGYWQNMGAFSKDDLSKQIEYFKSLPEVVDVMTTDDEKGAEKLNRGLMVKKLGQGVKTFGKKTQQSMKYMMGGFGEKGEIPYAQRQGFDSQRMKREVTYINPRDPALWRYKQSIKEFASGPSMPGRMESLLTTSYRRLQPRQRPTEPLPSYKFPVATLGVPKTRAGSYDLGVSRGTIGATKTFSLSKPDYSSWMQKGGSGVPYPDYDYQNEERRLPPSGIGSGTVKRYSPVTRNQSFLNKPLVGAPYQRRGLSSGKPLTGPNRQGGVTFWRE